jgi:two-component system LytT family response regulator
MSVKRVIIVDDEPLAREGLKLALQSCDDVQIIAECSNGFEAIEALRKLKTDVLFLDIQMPQLSGFDVLELLGEEAPLTVFVTAYDEYAVKAFEAQALDYLLKPVQAERLKTTLRRIDRYLERGQRPAPGSALKAMPSSMQPLMRILVREQSQIKIIPIDEVLYLEAQGDYISICTASQSYLKYERLSQIERRLDSQNFIRIHRSYIVNLDFLKKIEPYSRDSRLAVLRNGKQLPVSRAGFERIKQVL